MMYFNWQGAGTPTSPYTRTSPNIRALIDFLLAGFGGKNWGTFSYRPVRGGTSWSTHAFGAATDWAFESNRALALEVIDFLILHHEILGVQCIVDEDWDRTWKCSRVEYGGGPGWKVGVISTGGPWLHIETNPDNWANAAPVAGRLPVAAPPPVPVPQPDKDDDMTSARMWRHPLYHNVWLIGPSTVHLSPALAGSYTADGVPIIVEAHDQTLKTCLFQCGLTADDLVHV